MCQYRKKRLLPDDSTGFLVVSKALFLYLNLRFLNRISLLLIWSSYSIVLTRLGGPRSKPYTSRKIYGNGDEGWLGYPDLCSGQKPWWNGYLNCVVNFGEDRRAQLANSILLTSMLGPLGSFRFFKVRSDATREWGKQREATESIYHSSWVRSGRPAVGRTATLVPEFAV